MRLPAVAGAILALAYGAPALAACEPADHEHFVCGMDNSEDLVTIPGTKWVIAGGMAAVGRPQGHLYIVDSFGKTAEAVAPDAIKDEPDVKSYPGCPGRPDPKIFGVHGVSLRPAGKNRYTLYAINHGGRESVEIFRVDIGDDGPKLAWLGCEVVTGGHVFLDGVVGLPDGGFIATSLFDPTTPNLEAQLAAGTAKGKLLEWHAKSGWKPVAGGDIVTPNGLDASPDGKELYIASWAAHKFLRLARGGAKPDTKSVGLPFMPDNVRWGDDGKLYVGGQDTTIAASSPCVQGDAIRCTPPWAAATIDPQTLAVTMIVHRGEGSVFGGGTTAIPVGDELWVGTYRGDRIARLTPEDLGWKETP